MHYTAVVTPPSLPMPLDTTNTAANRCFTRLSSTNTIGSPRQPHQRRSSEGGDHSRWGRGGPCASFWDQSSIRKPSRRNNAAAIRTDSIDLEQPPSDIGAHRPPAARLPRTHQRSRPRRRSPGDGALARVAQVTAAQNSPRAGARGLRVRLPPPTQQHRRENAGHGRYGESVWWAPDGICPRFCHQTIVGGRARTRWGPLWT